MAYGTVYRVNPSWLCRIVLAGADGETSLTARDNALVLEVAGRLATHYPDRSSSEADLRHALGEYRDGRGGEPVEVSMSVTEAATGLSARTHADLRRSVDRVSTATNRGERCFDDTRVEGDRITFTVARNRALFDAHLVFATKMQNRPLAERLQGHVLADRHFARVCPRIMSGWTSAASAPIAARFVTWIHTPRRDGLDEARQQHVDDAGCLVAQVAPEELVDFLGLRISASRRAPSQVDEVLDRVRVDLMDVPLSLSVSRQRSRKVTFAVGLRAFVPAERTEHWMRADPVTRDTGRAIVRGRSPFPLPPVEPTPFDEEDPPHEPVVEDPRPDPVVRPIRAGRAVLSRPAPVPAPVPAAPIPVAPPSEDPHVDDDGLLHDPHDPLARVKGFVGRLVADDGERKAGDPVYETDHALLDIGGKWYPHVVYPAIDPARPWLQVVVEKPLREGGPSTLRTSPCAHLPCPDLDRVPHMHAHGVWASESAAVVGRAPPDECLHIDFALPTDDGGELRYAETRAAFDEAVAGVRGWKRPPHPSELKPAAPSSGSKVDEVRREWCEVNGVDADDPSVWTPLDD